MGDEQQLFHRAKMAFEGASRVPCSLPINRMAVARAKQVTPGLK